MIKNGNFSYGEVEIMIKKWNFSHAVWAMIMIKNGNFSHRVGDDNDKEWQLLSLVG